MKKISIVLVLLIALNMGFIWYGKASFNATVQSMAKAFADQNLTPLQTTAQPPAITKILEKYDIHQKPYRTIVLELEGLYRKRDNTKPIPLHTIVLLRPSCDWLWAMEMKPNFLVTFNALKTYHGAQAKLQTMLFGLIPTGTVEDEAFTKSELAKLLAYAPFNPALLASPSVRYLQKDDHHIHATITDNNLSASVIFTLDKEGRIIEASSHDCVLPSKKGAIHAPWHLEFSHYGDHNGDYLPSQAKEIWELPKAPFIQTVLQLRSHKLL